MATAPVAPPRASASVAMPALPIARAAIRRQFGELLHNTSFLVQIASIPKRSRCFQNLCSCVDAVCLTLAPIDCRLRRTPAPTAHCRLRSSNNEPTRANTGKPRNQLVDILGLPSASLPTVSSWASWESFGSPFFCPTSARGHYPPFPSAPIKILLLERPRAATVAANRR